MTRRRVLCGLLLALALLACFAGWLWVTAPRVTRERFEQVKEGMSREEVIRTLGGAVGEPGTQVGFNSDKWYRFNSHEWHIDGAVLIVYFDDAGTVRDVTILDFPPPPPPRTLFARIHNWLGRWLGL
jgi:outer membrane protein assembly factor BamE (lipoprotein component of BamABCDE complex)